jgi:hypothetical protein
MEPTTSPAIVTDRGATLQDLAKILTAQLLGVRAAFLGGRAPKNERVHQLQRDMAYPEAGGDPRKKAIERTMAIEFHLIDDGAPAAAVNAWHYSAIALNEARAVERVAERTARLSTVPYLRLIQTENRVQAERDAVERELLDNPECIDTHDRFLVTSARYEIVNNPLVNAVRQKRAHLMTRGQPMSA